MNSNLRWSEADLTRAMLKNPDLRASNPSPEGVNNAASAPPSPVSSKSAVSARKMPKAAKKRSAPEMHMEAILMFQFRSGEIRKYESESIKLSVGDPCCWYRPDFSVHLNDGRLRFIEMKGGFIREDAMVKFRSAKKQYPYFEFEMWQLKDHELNRIL